MVVGPVMLDEDSRTDYNSPSRRQHKASTKQQHQWGEIVGQFLQYITLHNLTGSLWNHLHVPSGYTIQSLKYYGWSVFLSAVAVESCQRQLLPLAASQCNRRSIAEQRSLAAWLAGLVQAVSCWGTWNSDMVMGHNQLSWNGLAPVQGASDCSGCFKIFDPEMVL